jgi:hypothetical protein
MKFAVAFAIGAALALGACQQGPLPNLAPGATAFIVPPPAPPPPPPPPPVIPTAEYSGLPQGTVVYRKSRSGKVSVARKACPAGWHFEGKRKRILVAGGTQIVPGRGRCVRG